MQLGCSPSFFPSNLWLHFPCSCGVRTKPINCRFYCQRAETCSCFNSLITEDSRASKPSADANCFLFESPSCSCWAPWRWQGRAGSRWQCLQQVCSQTSWPGGSPLPFAVSCRCPGARFLGASCSIPRGSSWKLACSDSGCLVSLLVGRKHMCPPQPYLTS